MALVGKRRRIRQQLKTRNNGLNDPKYLASCYGKLRRTKQEAYEEAKQRPEIVKAYNCTYCDYYHIGRRQ